MDETAVVRHESDLGWWETASRPAHPRLRGLVTGYTGYRERTAVPRRLAQLPSDEVTLILGFGEPGSASRSGWRRRRWLGCCVSRPRCGCSNAGSARSPTWPRKAAGAEIVSELRDTEHGSRDYNARDPEGHLWAFSSYAP